MTKFDKLKATSLVENITELLRGKILSGELKPGDRLPAERDIAEQMGVSRSSLHQAVLQLESEGFLRIEPRRGTVVADYRKYPTPQSLSALCNYGSVELDEPIFKDMMDTRLWVEMECARRACTNIYASTMEEMRDIANRLESENVELPKLIYRYHYLLTQASGNSIFSMMFRAFEPVILSLIARHYSLQAVDIHEAANMHKELLDHIEAKDEAAAASCVRRLLGQGVTVLERKYHSEA